MVLTKVSIPRTINTPPPTRETHFLNRGALFRSQPMTPPNTSIGEIAVPSPNKTATAKLSLGEAKDTELVNQVGKDLAFDG